MWKFWLAWSCTCLSPGASVAVIHDWTSHVLSRIQYSHHSPYSALLFFCLFPHPTLLGWLTNDQWAIKIHLSLPYTPKALGYRYISSCCGGPGNLNSSSHAWADTCTIEPSSQPKFFNFAGFFFNLFILLGLVFCKCRLRTLSLLQVH